MSVASGELCWETALGLGRRIRSGEISTTEMTREFLAAIKEFNEPLNAVVTLDEEGALKRSAEIERLIASGELDDSPLAGVPFLAKDLDITAGVLTTFGSLNHKDYIPNWDMTHIARLKDAGCVLLGKTNTPEDGVIPNTYNPVFGATRNPWNLERCPGGSSGGSASAIAAGLAPLATGSDGGGSIRLPCSLCGAFGIKPTFGTIAFGPKGIGVFNTMGHLGPITRTVEDSAAMLEVMAGGDERDRGSLAAPADLISTMNEPFKPKKLAYSVDMGFAKVKPDVRDLFLGAIEKLRAEGWPLEEASPGFDSPGAAIHMIIGFEWGTIPMRLERQNKEAYDKQDDSVKALVEFRKSLTLDDLWDAYATRKAVGVAMGRLFEQYDLLLTPALTRTAFEVGRPWPSDPEAPEGNDGQFSSMLSPFNFTGDPACSIPIGLTDEGLPVGLQIVGPRHADGRVLQAALAYERLSDFTGRRPPHGVGA